MNAETPNTNPQKSDFDFITQQTQDQHPKKKRSKKMLVLFGLLGMLVIVAIISLVFGARQQVQQEPPEVTTEQLNLAKDTVLSFLNLNQEAKYSEAAALFSSDSVVTKEQFETEGFKLFAGLDIAKCQPVEEITDLVDDNGRIIQTYKCPSKDDPELIVGLEFHVDDNNGQMTIYEYQIVDFE